MVNAGIYELIVVDSHIAEIWSKVLKNLILREDLVIKSGGNIAWAIRKENPQLLASLNDFVKEHGQGKELGNVLISRYFKDTK